MGMKTPMKPVAVLYIMLCCREANWPSLTLCDTESGVQNCNYSNYGEEHRPLLTDHCPSASSVRDGGR